MITCQLRTAALALALLAGFGCQHLGLGKADEEGAETAAIVNGETITVADLDEYIREQLFAEATGDGNVPQLYRARTRFLEQMITEKVLDAAAAAEDLSADDYVEARIEAMGEVPEVDIVALYQEHIDKVGDKTVDDLRPQLVAFLEQQRMTDLVVELRNASNAEIVLEQPRIPVEAIGPSKGPEDAVVTIVEFSDFECPFCQRVLPTIDRILVTYPTQVRFVYRNLPLGIHPRAVAAAEAALCADRQGEFWPYHDLIFGNQKHVGEEDLRNYATQLDLDMEAFERCVASRETQAAVEADIEAARDAGLSGTPSFLINGIPFSGAHSFETLSATIDAEIARAQSGEAEAAR